MLKITLTVDYALRVVVYLARFGKNRYISSSEIAKEQQIPPLYVSKILQCLSKVDILTTIPGRKGGAKLQRNPDEITVLEVIEAIDGSFLLNRCLNNIEQCSRSSFCKMRPFWVKTQKSLVNTLGQAKISHFINSAL
ncbi:MAG: RrF2 family transcriptional regulator [Planctomycetota bacterium]|jgi:Rrf2 family protein